MTKAVNKQDYVWSVYVGGSEVNSSYLRWLEAIGLARSYELDDYDDVWLVDTEGYEIHISKIKGVNYE